MLLVFVPPVGREQNRSLKDNLRAADDEKASIIKENRSRQVQMKSGLKAVVIHDVTITYRPTAESTDMVELPPPPQLHPPLLYSSPQESSVGV